MCPRILSFLGNVLRKMKILPQFPSEISKTKLQNLPIKFYEGDIHFINSEAGAQRAAAEIMGEAIVGFDTESKPAFSKGEKYLPSIVQIATQSGAYVFQLAKIGQLRFLKPIFECENLLKTGIAIHDDVLKLRDIEDFKANNFQDISDLTKVMGIKQTGLRNLAGIFLRCRISKISQVTDWSQENLSPRQLIYAATDAWISRDLYLEVKKHMP